MTESNKLATVTVSVGSPSKSVGTLSDITGVVSSLAGSSTIGSRSTGASAEKGDGTFNTLSSVIYSFSATTSCCKVSISGDTSSSVSVDWTLISSSVAVGEDDSINCSATTKVSSGLISF